jgi:general stress protein 26
MAGIDRNVKRIGELLKKIDIAMLTTTGADGFLMSRPLSTQDARFDGRRVWFFTETDSPKVAEIRRNPKVNLAYASKGKNVYVSMTGTARLNRDPEMIEELWNDAMKAFFPKGKSDPNLTLLEVDVHSIEYWDGPGSWIGKAVSFIIARVTKNEEAMGENRIVDLSAKQPRKRLPPSHANARAGVKAAAAKAPKKAAKTTGKTTAAKHTGTTKRVAGKRTAAAKKPAAKRTRRASS